MLLICDEVWVGCGRTGKWFGHQHWGMSQPDIMTLGKAIGCGLAVGGGVRRADRAAPHTSMRSAHGPGRRTPRRWAATAVSMAVAARMFEVLERDGLVERMPRTLGESDHRRVASSSARSTRHDAGGAGQGAVPRRSR
jgi:4-aminobutyrate aminotransferase-like enzyme